MNAPDTLPALSNQAPAERAALSDRLFRNANAIWMREMRQSARLARTPWILFALTLSISLLMCAIGGIAAEETSPAILGSILFQVFFSLAYIVVVVVGPAIAANSIASEREGRTWEAVLLAGLTPAEIARGKFLAAYTTVALYIVVLAPVGALSFLFGGVTATEVIIAFVFLFLLAALGVAFGLTISSLMSSLRGALVVTLILAFLLGTFAYSTFGFGFSLAVHEIWDDVPEAAPIWLPLAYSRAPFALNYFTLLVLLPLLLMLVPAWFFYETTISNLMGDADDRSSGIKRWFVACTPLLALAAAIPSVSASSTSARLTWSLWGLSLFALHIGFCVLRFGSEPPGPSRRVRIHWERDRAGFLRRFFGPGLIQTQVLAALMGVAGTALIAAVDIASILRDGYTAGSDEALSAEQIGVFAAYQMLFCIFVVGWMAWLRARNPSAWTARLVACGVLFLISAAPWVVAAIGGAISSGHTEGWYLTAAPSPFFTFYMLKAISHAAPGDASVWAGMGAAAFWGLLGLLLLALAWQKTRKTIAAHDAAIAQADAALAAEDTGS